MAVHVSHSLVEPPANRANMGSVDVFIHMSSMAHPGYDTNRFALKRLEMMRILQRLYRECGVIDLESMCVKINEQVFLIARN